MSVFAKLIPAVLEMAKNVDGGSLSRETFTQVLDSVVEDHLRRAHLDPSPALSPAGDGEDPRRALIAAMSWGETVDPTKFERASIGMLVDMLRQDRDKWRIRAQGPGQDPSREQKPSPKIRDALLKALGPYPAQPVFDKSVWDLIEMLEQIRVSKTPAATVAANHDAAAWEQRLRAHIAERHLPDAAMPDEGVAIEDLIDILARERNQALDLLDDYYVGRAHSREVLRVIRDRLIEAANLPPDPETRPGGGGPRRGTAELLELLLNSPTLLSKLSARAAENRARQIAAENLRANELS